MPRVPIPVATIIRRAGVKTSVWHRTANTRVFSAATAHGLREVKPFLLADIGEGIREVQIIQWFVQPGARVEEFDRLCEVQSDKASVEITSRFSGIIKKLHYDSDDMAFVGKPLVDIDIQGNMQTEANALSTLSVDELDAETQVSLEVSNSERLNTRAAPIISKTDPNVSSECARSKHHALATPAVRRMIKECGISVNDVRGTGKDGRVSKEDVQRHVASDGDETVSSTFRTSAAPSIIQDKQVPLTQSQIAMFKTMTKSLSIPHFLYSDTIKVDALTVLRQQLQKRSGNADKSPSMLAFVVKALSQCLTQYPILNSRIGPASDGSKPYLGYRGSHDIGIAVDAPSGLLVPIIRNVQNLSIVQVAVEIQRLAHLGRQGKLSTADMTGGSFSVSNIGSIGGGVVSPIIVEGQMGILGIGRARTVPAFDAKGNLVAQEEVVLSWGADHRIIDGATIAKCCELMKGFLEDPGSLLIRLR